MRYVHDYRPGIPVHRCDFCRYERAGNPDAVLAHEQTHAKPVQHRESELLGPDGKPALVAVEEESVVAAAREVVRYEFNQRLRGGEQSADEEEA